MLIALLCFLIISAGLVIGYWHVIAAWFRGGETQIALKDPALRGKHRHARGRVSEARILVRDHLLDHTWSLVLTTTGHTRAVWEA